MSLHHLYLVVVLVLLSDFVMSTQGASTKKVSVEVLDYNDLMNGKDCSDQIERAYGEHGCGILTVKNVPGIIEARRSLLPLAKDFASLDDAIKLKYENKETFYSFGWSHGKEKLQGKPDVSKGSYYANPQYDEPSTDAELIKKYPAFLHPNIWPKEDLPQLEMAFKSLGRLIVDTGTLVAQQVQLILLSISLSLSLSLYIYIYIYIYIHIHTYDIYIYIYTHTYI